MVVQKDNKEIIAEIKNTLQYPHTILEIMSGKDAAKNRIPRYCIEDALKEVKQVVKQLNKLAGWEGEKDFLKISGQRSK